MAVETLIKEDIGGAVSTFHYADEVIATKSKLSSVTCKVYKPGGGELIASTSVTAATTGEMSVNISAANAAYPNIGYRAHFQYTYDSTTYTQDVWFHIAPTDFDIPVHFSDIENAIPDLDDYDDATNNYHFYKEREGAEAELYGRLVNAGYEPHRIIRRFSLGTTFRWLWLSYVCDGGLSTTPSDRWGEWSDKFRALYEVEFEKMNLIEDTVNDANIGAKEAVPTTETKIKRG